MQEAYVFVLILLAGGTLFCIGVSIQAIKNPRRVWDRQHARDVKNGEPTDESLVRIRRNAWIGLILTPIVTGISAVALTWRFDDDQKKEAQQRQQARGTPKRNSDVVKPTPLNDVAKPRVVSADNVPGSVSNRVGIIGFDGDGKPVMPQLRTGLPAANLPELRAALARSFAALRKQGIVAEPKFEDCVRCAVAAMSDLFEERNAPGGVYWHDQDDDALEQGEDLMIGFVARKDDDAAAIAQKLVAALKAEGLTVEWDGSAEKRITVKVPWTKPEPPGH